MGARATIIVAIAISLVAAGLSGAASQGTQPVPEAAEAGLTVAPLVSLPAPTAIAFGPGQVGDPASPDLYVTSLDGKIYRVQLDWRPTGPVATDLEVWAQGFNQPLGIAFDDQGIAYISDSTAPEHPDRTVDGIVYWLDDDGERRTLVDNLPNGRHNTNNLAFGPDGRLYIPNGNPNDNGQAGGAADVFPYSGAILSVDTEALRGDPAVLQWHDADGQPLAPDEVAQAPVNDAFEAKVTVEGYGLRNVYDVTFGPDGVPITAMNGADDPSSQDVLVRLDEPEGTFHGFPFCYDQGQPGAVTGIEKIRNPIYEGQAVPEVPEGDCTNTPTAEAMLGWHTCTTGVDTPVLDQRFSFQGELARSVYVAECTAFFAQDLVTKTLAHPTTHSTSHKVLRVELGPDGNATEVRDVVTGLAAPTDVRFGPQGAMYIADQTAIYRVAPAAAMAG